MWLFVAGAPSPSACVNKSWLYQRLPPAILVLLWMNQLFVWRDHQRHKYHHLTTTLQLTLKMTTAQVFETSVTNNSLSKDYPHPDEHVKQITDAPGFKPFTLFGWIVAVTIKLWPPTWRDIVTEGIWRHRVNQITRLEVKILERPIAMMHSKMSRKCREKLKNHSPDCRVPSHLRFVGMPASVLERWLKLSCFIRWMITGAGISIFLKVISWLWLIIWIFWKEPKLSHEWMTLWSLQFQL